MNKKTFFSLLLITLFITVYEVKADCSYSFHYEIEDDEFQYGSDVGTSYLNGRITDVKKKKGNWEGKSNSWLALGGDEKILDWDEDTCPDFIGVVKAGTAIEWYGFSKEKVLDKGVSLVDLVDKSHMWVYKNDDVELQEKNYTCDYEDFTITFDPKGYALYAESKFSTVNVTYLYTLSERMINEPVAKIGVCEDVHYCLTSGAYSENTKNYKIFVDELDYENNKSVCQETLFLGEVYSNSAGDYGNGCRTYDNYIKDLKVSHIDCEFDKSYCSTYSNLKNRVSTLCNSLTKYASYSSSACLRKCLNFKNDILSIEKDTKDSDGQCGLSSKLILWIANIVKWLKYIVPVIVIVLGILDFIKAIGTDKDDEMKKAQGRFVKRLIAAALIFIIPFIIEFVLDKMEFDANGCGIIDL